MPMHFRNSAESYGIVAQAFHWVIAALVFVQFGIGTYAGNLPVSLARLRWLSHHKALGITILALVLLRLLWRLFNRPPRLPVARGERHAAAAVHWSLYVLLIAAPLAGWLHASGAGLSTTWFGMFRVPDLIRKDPGLAALFHDLHVMFVALLAALVLLHVAAALRHAWRRDDVIRRMLPWRRK